MAMPPRREMTTPYFLESVDRVMKVLDCFTVETPELRLTDLSGQLGMPKTQVLRIVSTLEGGGYLARDERSKRYRLGVRLVHLGTVVRERLDIRRIAQPYLHRLVETTQETAGLFVPDPPGPICIDVVQSPKAMRVYAQLGARMPWHAGTSPKVLLAYLPDPERERILARGQFRRFTDNTVTDPDRIRAILCEIRRTGYHVGVRDLDENALGVAAPIFDDRGRIAGAIGLAAPAVRLPDGVLDRFIALVREATAEVSRQMGYRVDQMTTAADD